MIPGYTSWLEDVFNDVTQVFDDVSNIMGLSGMLDLESLNSETLTEILPQLQNFLMDNKPDRIFEK